MSIKLPPPPRLDMLVSQDAQGRPMINQSVLRELRTYLETLGKVLLPNSGSVAWGTISFVESKLTDIQTRPHSALQNVEQADMTNANTDRNKHVSNAMTKGWEEHRALTILAHGGIVAMDKFAIPGVCWQGYFQDPEGNTFGLFEPNPTAQ